MRTSIVIIGLFYHLNSWGQDFKPDTTLNQIILESRASIIKKLKSDTAFIKKYFYHAQETEYPHLDMRTTDQKLTLYFHPGNWTWAFSEFKVEPWDKDATTQRVIRLSDKEFVTEKGIKLGTPKSELLKKIGRPTSIKREKGFEVIEYRTSDPKAKILKNYNQAEYFAIYKLKADKVIEFHFGFVNP